MSASASPRGRRLLAAGSALILLLAVLPAVSSLGLWPIPGAGAAVPADGDTIRQQGGHCQLSSAACSDHPGHAGACWCLPQERWALPLEAGPREVGVHSHRALSAPLIVPPKPPPRPA